MKYFAQALFAFSLISLHAPKCVSMQIRYDSGFRVESNFKWQPAPLANPQIRYYMADELKSEVQTAVSDVQSAARVLRDVMRNPVGNETTAAMMDHLFRGAFSDPEKGSENMERVAKTYDAIARGVVVNRANPSKEANARFISLSDREARKIIGNQNVESMVAWYAATVYFRFDFRIFAELTTYVSLLQRPGPNQGKICKSVKWDYKRYIGHAVGHEFAHLVGVTRADEAYTLRKLLLLGWADALDNAETYAYALLCEFITCLPPRGDSGSSHSSSAD